MSSLVEGTKFPLEDGQVIEDRRGRTQRVMGSIVIERGWNGRPDTYNDAVCWTRQGNWYRRSDGEEMTGASGGTANPMTVAEFFKQRREGGMGGVG